MLTTVLLEPSMAYASFGERLVACRFDIQANPRQVLGRWSFDLSRSATMKIVCMLAEGAHDVSERTFTYRYSPSLLLEGELLIELSSDAYSTFYYLR
jgi:hypothetical protein